MQLQSQLSHAAALPDAQAASQDSDRERRSTKRQVSFASTLATNHHVEPLAGSSGEGTAEAGLADKLAASMQQKALVSTRCSFSQSDAGCTPMPRRSSEEQWPAADGEAAASTRMPDCEALADRLVSLPSPEEVIPQTSASLRRCLAFCTMPCSPLVPLLCEIGWPPFCDAGMSLRTRHSLVTLARQLLIQVLLGPTHFFAHV